MERCRADECCSTGATKVMPVVHIVRRQNFDALVNKEKDMSDTAPVIAPSYNRSGEQNQES